MNRLTTSGGVRAIQRLLPLAVLLLASIAVPYLVFAPSGLGRLGGLQKERASVQQEASRLQFEIRQLKHEVEMAQTRPEVVERMARDELGLVRQTELVFQFSP